MNSVIKFIAVCIVVFIIGFGAYMIGKGDDENTPSMKTEENDQSDQEDAAALPQNAAELLAVKADELIIGDKNAPVSLIEYSDYQCPYCVRFGKTVESILPAYAGRVKLVFRHLPLPFHQAAPLAAQAAEAANRQGKFAEYSALLIANSQSDGKGILESDLLKYAEDLKLNIDQFKKDIEDPAIKAKIEADAAGGDKLGVNGTPGSFVVSADGAIQPVEGAVSYEDLKSKFDKALGL